MSLKLGFVKSLSLFSIATMMILLGGELIAAQTSSFTYQGHLIDGGTAANGNYDFQFVLWDSVSGGAPIGTTQQLSTVSVSNGVFNVTLDFGSSSFNGANRFLEISVRPTGSGPFTLLTPREQIRATPYALRSSNASSADSLSGLCSGCITDANISGLAGSKINGTIAVSAIPAGSGNYIQNSASQQAATNFNVSGNGTAAGTLSGNIVNAATQFNLGGTLILSNPGTNNLFLGVGTGQANTNGSNNTFFGPHAGQANVFGSDNTFFGVNAGFSNTGGLLGGGRNNTFFGSGAGQSNTLAEGSSFFGQGAGQSNTTGNFNTFIGRLSGNKSGTGRLNTFLGAIADFTVANAAGDKNTLVGASTQINSGISNATAVGAQAMVTQSNSLVLGSINGVNGATVNASVGIGTTAPIRSLQIGSKPGAEYTLEAGDSPACECTPAGYLRFGDGTGFIFTIGRSRESQGGPINVGPDGAIMTIIDTGGVSVNGTFNAKRIQGSDFTAGGYGTRGDGRDAGLVGASPTSASFDGVDGVGVRAYAFKGNLMEGYHYDGSNNLSNATRKFHITNDGSYVGGSDFAEALPALGPRTDYEPGDVLVISSMAATAVEKSSKPNDVRLAGVYSTRPGVLGAEKGGTSRVDPDDLPVAIIGIVPTKVSTENGPIQVGDLLTTSSTPGYAMRATPVKAGRARVYRTGTILGKALEPLENGKGVVKVLITLK